MLSRAPPHFEGQCFATHTHGNAVYYCNLPVGHLGSHEAYRHDDPGIEEDFIESWPNERGEKFPFQVMK